MVACSSLQSGTLAPSMTAPSGPPCSSTSRLLLVPGLPRSVGFLPTFFPPEAGLAQPAVGALPPPVDLAQFLALGGQGGPDAFHHAVAAPALEPAVDGGVVAELPGQVVPLAAAPQTVDDAVEHSPPVPGRAAALGAVSPVLLEDGLDAGPEVVADLPEGLQRLGPGTLPCHDGGSSWIAALDRKPYPAARPVLR